MGPLDIDAASSSIVKPLMAANMFGGFDHTEHKAEVEERWGADAFANGDDWWRAKSAEERAQWMLDQKPLASERKL